MKRYWKLIAGLALIPAIVWATASTPYGIFGGTGTFAQLPGNVGLTFTAAPTGTSATLKATWTGTTGAQLVVFSDWESRSVTLTNNATTATWSGALVGTPTATATIDGFTATPGAGTMGFTSDLGQVFSNGTSWFATSEALVAPIYVSSGCQLGEPMLLERNRRTRTDLPIQQAACGSALSAPDQAHKIGLRKNPALLIATACACDLRQDRLE